MQDPVPAIGLTSRDHCQPGWKVPLPMVKSPSVTTSRWPFAWNFRVSFAVSMLRDSSWAMICLLRWARVAGSFHAAAIAYPATKGTLKSDRRDARFRPPAAERTPGGAQVSRAVMVNRTGTDRAVVTKIESRARVVERL